MTGIISTAGLSASYDRHEVLHSVDSSLTEGEFVCILGPNGSGKSTFLTAIAGLDIPSLTTTGDCQLSGKSIKSYTSRERAKLITFLPQNEIYTWNYSVLEAVRMGRYAKSEGFTGYTAEDTARAREALSKAGIAHLENRYIFELSGGELQSVLVARAFAQDTQVLLLDEPFTYLDVGKADKLIRLLKEITRSEKKSVIMSIHDINLAPLYADRIMLFSEGRLIADGKPLDVFKAENLEKAYGTPFAEYTHPVYGVPQVCAK